MKTNKNVLYKQIYVQLACLLIGASLSLKMQATPSIASATTITAAPYKIEVDKQYNAYRKIKLNFEQNISHHLSEKELLSHKHLNDNIFKFQIWYSDKPFSSKSNASLHSEIFLSKNKKLNLEHSNLIYETCWLGKQQVNYNETGQAVITLSTQKWSCEVSGLIPDKRYWFALSLISNLNNEPVFKSEQLTTISAVTHIVGESPPPPDTDSITYFLSGLVFSICLLLIFLRRKDILSMKRGSRIAHIYIGPALISLSVLTFYPIGYGIWLAFTDANQTHLGLESWIGLGNFYRVFETQGALRVTIFSFFWAFISVLCHVIFGLIYALLLNRKGLRGKVFYRTVLLLPWAIPGYISILAWKGLLQTDGLLNMILFADYDYLANVLSAKISVIFVSVWLGIPFMMMSLSGSLVSIPQDMYEAAKIDGVNKWNQFWHLTLPNLKGTLVPLSLLSFIFTFNSFNTIFLLTRGGPRVGFGEPGATDILITYVYDIAFNLGQYGLAAAWSFVIFIMLVFFSFIYMKKTNATEALS